jgi:DNA-binding MltR family transcriptional regulator
MNVSHRAEALERSIALVEELERQSDRGAAIVGLAWVEEALQESLISFLKDEKKAQERFFRQSGPLAALAAKIDLALLLGMCTQVIAADLHSLRKIRNDFAHTVLAADNSSLRFETAHIRDKCMALQCVAHEDVDGPRHAFIRACAVLNADFYTHKFMGQKVADGGKVFAPVEDGMRRDRRRHAG